MKVRKVWMTTFAALLGSILTSFAQAPENLVPVNVVFRGSKVGSSLVAQFTNATTDKHLALQVTVLSKTLGTTTVKILRLKPGEAKSLGWAQRVAISSGDAVTLTDGNYEKKTVVAP